MNIIYEKIDAYKHNAFYKNGKFLGELIMDVDGYFYFWPEDNNRAWASHHLREITNKLDELNKEWDEQVEKETKL